MPKLELTGEDLFNLALAIVGVVHRAGSLSTAELAEHFGVSQKSVQKAVRAVALAEDYRGGQDSFFELNWDDWENGEVSFISEATLKSPPPLSKHQSGALAAGLEFLAAIPQFIGNENLDILRRAISSQPAATTRVEPPSASRLLDQLRSAIMAGQRVEFRYQNQLGETSDRQLDPLRIDYLDTRHYLRGFCLTNSDLRSFRIDRISQLVITQTQIPEKSRRSQIPDEIFGNDPGTHLVSILAQPHAAEVFWNFPTEREPVMNRDGLLEGQIRIGNLRAIGRHIARYGGAVRVVAPQAAVQIVRDFAQDALNPKTVKVD